MACKNVNNIRLGDDIGDKMLSITVGKDNAAQTFSIHKALLQKMTKYFDKLIATEDGQMGLIFLKDEDPEVFKLFYDWLYTGNIPKAPGTIPINRRPAEAEIQRLETELRGRFDAHVRKLCILYYLGEKYNIEHLLNNTISIIQDSFYEYGTVFGPALLILVFKDTQKGSKLRELCLAANVIHIDRGCEKLRGELIMASLMTDDCFANMMTWISRNFAMFGRRQTEGYDVMKPTQGFNILNRKKLCPCHFHKHTNPKDAHKNHKKCAVPYRTCGHEDEKAESMDTSA